MIEKPDLPEEKIIAALQEGYGISLTGLDFLPLGNDATAWVYEARAAGGSDYFLKVKKGRLYPPSVTIPRFLRDQGIPQVVAPLPARNHMLWQSIDSFALILYPFIEGRMGMEVGLTDGQWVEFGQVLNRIHSTRLPEELSNQVERETFHPKWSGMVKELQSHLRRPGMLPGVAGCRTACPAYKEELAAFWEGRQAEIKRIVERAEALGQLLLSAPPEFVLCHTDIHTANILLDTGGAMHIVDWDQPLLAPRERDLMFVVGTAGEMVALETYAQQAQRLFFSGYGNVDIHPAALTYYQYEWCIQEIGDFGERVFLMDDVGEATKQASVEGFKQLFEPGDVIDTAYNTDRTYFP